MSLTVTVQDASSPGPSGPIVGWDWDWGDSTTHGTGQVPGSHTYASAGTYTIKLVITGSGTDGTSTATSTITVSSGSPPAPPSTGWAWDATTATVRSDSSTVIPIFLAHGGPFMYFAAEVGVGNVTSHSPTASYEVSTAGQPGGPFDANIWFPNGVKPGVATDGHLAINDTVTGRWHDFEMFHQQGFVGGQVTGWTGGDSMPAGAIQEPKGGGAHGGATVAKFPLLQGLVTVDDVNAGVINHALVFTMSSCGPAPNPYPSNSSASYTGPNTSMSQSDWQHMPSPGTWIRLNPVTNISALSGFEHMIATALQNYGMFCRDRSTDCTLHGADVGGGGASHSAWVAAGVSLNSNMQLKFSSTFISLLSNLQVLVAPSP